MTASYRQILRSSSIIGGASVVNVLVGLARAKAAAVWLGPAGVGLIGLMQTLVATASMVAAVGVGGVGTRQIASAVASGDEVAVGAARRALFWGTLVLAASGAGVFWALRAVLADYVLDDPTLADEVGWLAIGVGLTVGAGSQTALIKGLRRTADVAWVSVLSAALATAVGVGALGVWRAEGLLVFVLAAPAATFLVGHVFAARLPRVATPRTPLAVLVGQWRELLTLGAAFMVSGVATTAGQLAVRAIVQNDLSADALGQFQASSAISMTYVGFVLAAMATDYYPRLTGVIADRDAVRRLVNEQTEVALILAGPVLLAMITLAPWVVALLYSDEFVAASEILRWQVLGDILKVASWPLAFVILASGDGRTYMLVEGLGIGVFVAVVAFGVGPLGVLSTGAGFLAMYAVYLPVVYGVARRKVGFSWELRVRRLMGVLAVGGISICVLARMSELAAIVVGLALTLGFAIHTVRRLATMAELTGPSARLSAWARKFFRRGKAR